MDENKLNIEIEKLRENINTQKLDRISKFSNLFSIVILVTLFCLFGYGSIRLNNLSKDIQDLEQKKQSEIIKYQSLKFDNNALEIKKRQLEKELMSTYGLSIDSVMSLSTNELLEKSLSANDAIKLILKKYTPNSNIYISYYNKTIDEKRVVLELDALGYKFNQKPASQYMEKKATNAIWFGAEVPIEDIKIVAFALIRAGVPIKGIRPYRNSSTNPSFKKNIIEVGASDDLDPEPQLTVNQIMKATKFIR